MGTRTEPLRDLISATLNEHGSPTHQLPTDWEDDGHEYDCCAEAVLEALNLTHHQEVVFNDDGTTTVTEWWTTPHHVTTTPATTTPTGQAA